MNWTEWKEGALGLLFPNVCQICGEQPAVQSEGYVCGDCWSAPGAIRFIRAPFCDRCGLPHSGDLTTQFVCANCDGVRLHFTAARSAVVATGLVKDVIHRYKYRKHVWFEPFLADLLLRELQCWLRWNPAWDCLVPVPLHGQKERERGFNQSRRIAELIGARTGLACMAGTIRRVRSTETQTHLSRKQRAANMRKAFATTGRYPVNGRRVILLDDVFTTGATTNACARELKRAGALAVCVWTVARGI